MGSVHRLDRAAGPELHGAVEGFLAQVPVANTARAYTVPLRALVAELGDHAPVTVLDDEAIADRIAAWFTGRWGTCSGATANARLDALRSAATWWRAQDWITGDPTRRIRRRPRTPTTPDP